MPEYRQDPIVKRSVIVARNRALRPIHLGQMVAEHIDQDDPFAEGHEAQTPPEILAYRAAGSTPNGPGWRVRVVPNKFPALQTDDEFQPKEDGFYNSLPGVGAHEVIIECPHAESNLSRLAVENIREVLAAYRDRLRELKRDSRLVHGLIFKNQGAAAGASLAHCHSQLIATTILPAMIQEELVGSIEYFETHGRCVFDDMLHQETETGARVVLETERFLVFCPFASRVPYETWILPKRHASHFENLTEDERNELGGVLKTFLTKLEVALDNPPFNSLIHSAPFGSDELPHYHWHIEILPRLTRVAGFEWGSGIFINPVAPEDAAQTLRDTEI